MFEQLFAYGLLCCFFPIMPTFCLWMGIQVGRLGWRPAITKLLTKIFGVFPESEGMEAEHVQQ